MILLLLLIPAAYTIGSIPFALITGRILKNLDIRDYGSGNAGATNVFRVLGLLPGITVLLLDFLKGFLPVLFLNLWIENNGGTLPEWSVIPVFSALIFGHIFPLWAGFRGGKAAACAAGGVTVLFPLGALFCLIIFVSTVYFSRKVSLGSLAAAWSLPLLFLLLRNFSSTDFSVERALFFLAAALLITLMHRKNLKRLVRGTEPGIGEQKKNEGNHPPVYTPSRRNGMEPERPHAGTQKQPPHGKREKSGTGSG